MAQLLECHCEVSEAIEATSKNYSTIIKRDMSKISPQPVKKTYCVLKNLYEY